MHEQRRRGEVMEQFFDSKKYELPFSPKRMLPPLAVAGIAYGLTRSPFFFSHLHDAGTYYSAVAAAAAGLYAVLCLTVAVAATDLRHRTRPEPKAPRGMIRTRGGSAGIENRCGLEGIELKVASKAATDHATDDGSGTGTGSSSSLETDHATDDGSGTGTGSSSSLEMAMLLLTGSWATFLVDANSVERRPEDHKQLRETLLEPVETVGADVGADDGDAIEGTGDGESSSAVPGRAAAKETARIALAVAKANSYAAEELARDKAEGQQQQQQQQQVDGADGADGAVAAEPRPVTQSPISEMLEMFPTGVISPNFGRRRHQHHHHHHHQKEEQEQVLGKGVDQRQRPASEPPACSVTRGGTPPPATASAVLDTTAFSSLEEQKQTQTAAAEQEQTKPKEKQTRGTVRSPVSAMLDATDSGIISMILGRKRRQELLLPQPRTKPASTSVSAFLSESNAGGVVSFAVSAIRRRRRRSFS